MSAGTMERLKRTVVILAVLDISVAIITFVGSSYPRFELTQQNLTLTFVAEILIFEFNVVILLFETSGYVTEAIRRLVTSEIVQVLTGEKDILDKAEEMLRTATEGEDIMAIWCVMYYNKTLQKHFARFAGKRVCRLINPQTVDAPNIKDHVKQLLKEITNGNYTIRSTTHVSSEFLIVGKRELLELIPHAVAGKLYRGLYTTDDHIVNAYVKDFEDLLKSGKELKITTENEANAERLTDEWIRSSQS